MTRNRNRNRMPCLCLEALEDRCLMATRIWDGGALSNNWSNAANWVGNVAPVAGDHLVFQAGVADKTADNDFADDTLFASIALGGGYTLRGNRVRVGAGGIVDNSGTSNIIKFDLITGLGGEITRTIQVGAGSTLFMDGELSGAVGFIKAGGGDLSLRSNNSYTGQTQVNAGRLFIEKDEGLGAGAGNTVIRGGATLFLNDSNLGSLKVAENIILEHGATLRAKEEVDLRGSLTTEGTGVIAHSAALSTRTFDLHSAIAGPGGLAFESGEVKLFGDNRSVGISTINAFVHLQSHGNAFFNDFVVNSGGKVRWELPNQIPDLCDIIVNGAGELELNIKEETIGSLTMNGGRIRTNAASDLEAAQALFLDLELAEASVLTIKNGLTATSTSAGVAARIDKAILELTDAAHAFVVNDGPAAIDAILRGSVILNSFVKRGDGTLQDTTNSKNAETLFVVEAGVLLLENEKEEADVTIREGGILAGTGQIRNLTVEAGGRLRPGPLGGPGRLGVTSNLAMQPGSILETTLNGPSAGSQHDQLEVDGVVSVAGAILEATLGAGAVVGQTYKLIDNSGDDGIFGAFFVPPATAPFLTASPTGQRLAFNYAGGSLNNDLLLTLQNTPPRAPDLALDRTELTRGQIVTATGSLVDPDGRRGLRLIVDWGDGSRRQVFRPGLEPFALRHRYRRAGEFLANFRWIDGTGQGNSREFAVTVNEAFPSISSNRLGSAVADQVFAAGLRR